MRILVLVGVVACGGSQLPPQPEPEPAPAPTIVAARSPDAAPFNPCMDGAAIEARTSAIEFDDVTVTDEDTIVNPQHVLVGERSVEVVFAPSFSDGVRVRLQMSTDGPLAPGTTFDSAELLIVGGEGFTDGYTDVDAEILELDDHHICMRIDGGDENYATIAGVLMMPI